MNGSIVVPMRLTAKALDARWFLLKITVLLSIMVVIAAWVTPDADAAVAQLRSQRHLRALETVRSHLPKPIGDALVLEMTNCEQLAIDVAEDPHPVRDVAASLAFFGALGCVVNFVPSIRRRISPGANGPSKRKTARVEERGTPDGFNVVIRPFEPGDQAALERLWGQVFADDPPWNAPAFMIANKLAVQPELLFVGLLEGKVVGAVMAGFDGVRGWLYHLAVAPESRRRGIATQLVRTAEARLRELGCPKVNLQVRASNAEVVAFYRSLGYVVEERVSMGRRFDGA